jgi:integrase
MATTNKLTEAAVKKAKPADKPYKLFDGNGMFLEVRAEGGKWWRHKFRFGGKEKLLSLGIYPEVGIAMARERRDRNRELLRDGIDPSVVQRAKRRARSEPAEGSFRAMTLEFLENQRGAWSEAHAKRWQLRMEHDVFPHLGDQDIDTITAPDLLKVARRIESRGAIETCHTVVQQCGQVFRYGIATGRCKSNPAPDLKFALKKVVVEHMAAVTKPQEAGALMRAIDTYRGSPITRAALLLSALTFQRPGNVRAAEWDEFDLESAMWKIASSKMKRTVQDKISGRPHLVPLSMQAVAELRDLHMVTGRGRFLFPSLLSADRCMSENTVNTALRRMGYTDEQMTAHGFRAMARTLLVDELDANPDVIEAQLAHAKSGPLGDAYDRSEFLAKRKALMQQWADYLDRLREGARVVAIRA